MEPSRQLLAGLVIGLVVGASLIYALSLYSSPASEMSAKDSQISELQAQVVSLQSQLNQLKSGAPTPTQQVSSTPTLTPTPTANSGPTQTPTPTNNITPLPTASDTPMTNETAEIQSVSLNGSTLTVYARSTSATDITLQSAIVKTDDGSPKGTYVISATLPRSGELTTITFDTNQVSLNLGTYTITLISTNGTSFVSPKVEPVLTSPSATEKVEIQNVSLSASSNTLTIYAKSTSGTDITFKTAVIKTSGGTTIANFPITTTLPSSGALTTIIIYTGATSVGSGSYTVTLTTVKGNSFVSPTFSG